MNANARDVRAGSLENNVLVVPRAGETTVNRSARLRFSKLFEKQFRLL